MAKNYISQEGFKKLQDEKEELKTTKRKEIAERLEEAKKFGDLSENAEYQEARDSQERNERRIAELDELIKTATIVAEKKKHDVVEVGSTVKAKSEEATINFTMVGSEETDPQTWRISNESPLGVAFMGKKKGDTVEVHAPHKKIKYTIVEIE
jgi:transcription elongation factor GreA